MVCLGSIPDFSGFQLIMASRDPRQAIRPRASVYSHGSFLVSSFQMSLNLTQHHWLFQGNLTFYMILLCLDDWSFPLSFRPMGNDSRVLTSSELLHNALVRIHPTYNFVSRTLILKNPLKFSNLRVPSVFYWEIHLRQSSFLLTTLCSLFRAHAFSSNRNIPANLA